MCLFICRVQGIVFKVPNHTHSMIYRLKIYIFAEKKNTVISKATIKTVTPHSSMHEKKWKAIKNILVPSEVSRIFICIMKRRAELSRIFLYPQSCQEYLYIL